MTLPESPPSVMPSLPLAEQTFGYFLNYVEGLRDESFRLDRRTDKLQAYRSQPTMPAAKRRRMSNVSPAVALPQAIDGRALRGMDVSALLTVREKINDALASRLPDVDKRIAELQKLRKRIDVK